MQNLLGAVYKAVENHNVVHVNKVIISVGQLSNALPDALSFAFKAMTQEGIMKDAELIIEETPAQAKCETCGREYTVDGFPIICPSCKGNRFSIISGDDVYIQSIDCEEG
jgi:hydrogenase nickel incorporation protein HypA/HybF